MADNGDESSEAAGFRSKIWLSMSRDCSLVFPDVLMVEEKGRIERKETDLTWHCRHTVGRLSASALIEKAFMTAAGAEASAMRRARLR